MRFTVSVAAVLFGLTMANGQEPGRIYRVAVLLPSDRAADALRGVMLPELTREGFSEGRNLVLDVRSGPPEQLKALAGELVAHRPDAILAVGTGPVIAAREATTAIPIVMFGADRLLSQRDTLSRPSGNATGFVIFGPELDAKRLHLLHEITEADRPIAALLPRGIGGVAARHAAIEAAAAALSREVHFFEADETGEYRPLFDAVQRTGATSIIFSADGQFNRDIALLSRLALEMGIGTICHWREMVQEGCLMSYGASIPGIYARSADYLARILKGTKPTDLPIEGPVRFELVINLKTAAALGLTIPPTLLARADEVIE